MWYLIAALILLWFVYSASLWLLGRRPGENPRNGKGTLNKVPNLVKGEGERDAEQTLNKVPNLVKGEGGEGGECCGKHSDCARNFLVRPAAAPAAPIYYDDEELDAYSNTAEDQYPPQAADEFREVLYSLRDNEVQGWLLSLQQRNVALPTAVKEEALFILDEMRV